MRFFFPLMNGVYDIANHEFKPFLVGKEKKTEYFFFLTVTRVGNIHSLALSCGMFFCYCLSVSASFIACTLLFFCLKGIACVCKHIFICESLVS